MGNIMVMVILQGFDSLSFDFKNKFIEDYSCLFFTKAAEI